MAEKAQRRYAEISEQSKPENRVDTISGKRIDDPDDYFGFSHLTDNPNHPIYPYNYLHFRKSLLPQWDQLDEVYELLLRYRPSGLWQGSGLDFILDVLKMAYIKKYLPQSPITVFAIAGKSETLQQIAQCLADEPNYCLMGQVLSGIDGLEQCKANMPDIVLIDRGIMDIHDIEVAKQLREISPSIGIVMLSDTNEVAWIRKAMLVGATEFLSKPIDKSELIITLNHLCRFSLT